MARPSYPLSRQSQPYSFCSVVNTVVQVGYCAHNRMVGSCPAEWQLMTEGTVSRLLDAGGINKLGLNGAPFRLSSTEVKQGHLPGYGLIFSVLFHALVLSGLIFIPPYVSVPRLPPLRVTMIDLKDPNYRLYLPVLYGAEYPNSAVQEDEPKPAPNKPAARSVNLAAGFSYPGPQPIVSDFPKPTNRIQTLLQPKLLDPPTLPPPLSLPNLVQMPDVAPAPKLTARLLMNPVMPVELPPPPQPIEQLELALTAIQPVIDTPALPVTPPPAPAIDEKEVSDARSRDSSPAPQTASDPKTESPSTKPAEPLLALSPAPAPPADTVNIPAGEARGRFAISPEPNLTTSEKSGINTKGETKNDIDPTAAGALENAGADGQTQGSRSPSAGQSGKSPNVFAGITILQSGAGTSPVSPKGNPAPVQTSYGMAVLSTEDSGGGLPRFGVFSTERIFTVFVEMRRTAHDTAPVWTAQYGVATSEAPKRPDSSPKGDQQGVVLPFPTAKAQPAFPRELVKKYPGRRMIVFAMITTDGKMDQISIKESPDPLLNQPLLEAMSKWSFRPAMLDGANIALKALFGVPLFSPF